MNFGKFSSVLFTFVQDDCHSRSRQGHVGKRGVGEERGGGGGEWGGGAMLEPAVRDDEKAGKTSS